MTLERALHEPGCPICRVCQTEVTRFMQFLLRENLKDQSTLGRIVAGMGFCRMHAWQLLELERRMWQIPFGNANLYETLLSEFLIQFEKITAFVEKNVHKKPRHHIGNFLAAWLTLQNEKNGIPAFSKMNCIVCESLQRSSRFYGNLLVDMLARSEMQTTYASSCCICLPHLRDIFFNHDLSEGLLFLVYDTIGRLKTIKTHLSEFNRKQSHQHRHEDITEIEHAAVMCVVEFFAGFSRD